MNARVGRRDFFSRLLVRLAGATSALAAFVPLPRYLLGAQASGGSRGATTDAGPLESIPAGGAKLVSHRGRPTLVIRGPSGPTAVSAICTHLGCVVRWNANEGQIRCPCHGARFAADGSVVSGPTRAPLPAAPLRVDAGTLRLG